MKESVRFYRLLGIDLPDAAADHLDATLPSGIRLMWDTLELTKQLDPDWVDPKGHRMGLAFECSSPGEVRRDSLARRPRWFSLEEGSVGRVLGSARRADRRPRRQRGGSL